MAGTKTIVSVDQIGDAILIGLRDQTAALITADQLLSLGLPRFPLLLDDESFEAAIRDAVNRPHR